MEEAYVLPIDVTCKYDVSSQMQSGFIGIPWEDVFKNLVINTHCCHSADTPCPCVNPDVTLHSYYILLFTLVINCVQLVHEVI